MALPQGLKRTGSFRKPVGSRKRSQGCWDTCAIKREEIGRGWLAEPVPVRHTRMANPTGLVTGIFQGSVAALLVCKEHDFTCRTQGQESWDIRKVSGAASPEWGLGMGETTLARCLQIGLVQFNQILSIQATSYRAKPFPFGLIAVLGLRIFKSSARSVSEDRRRATMGSSRDFPSMRASIRFLSIPTVLSGAVGTPARVAWTKNKNMNVSKKRGPES